MCHSTNHDIIICGYIIGWSEIQPTIRKKVFLYFHLKRGCRVSLINNKISPHCICMWINNSNIFFRVCYIHLFLIHYYLGIFWFVLNFVPMSAYLLSKCVLGIATIHLERELSFLQNPLNYTGPVKPLTKMYIYILNTGG